MLLLPLLSTIHGAASQTWEQSNDPDSLCATNNIKHTGYRPTRDCRGYVYCNDGYLMGGGAAGDESPSGVSGGTGVIACWPNQLFDVQSGVCTYWQQVDTSACPDYDGSMMMPEVTDGNANPERFFVSISRRSMDICVRCSVNSHAKLRSWLWAVRRLGLQCQAGVRGVSRRFSIGMLRPHPQLLRGHYRLSDGKSSCCAIE